MAEIENKYIKTDIPDIASGDTVKVSVRVTEGSRERIQAFEGIVIAIKGKGVNKAITVRKKSLSVVSVVFFLSVCVFGASEKRLRNTRKATCSGD